MADLSEAKSIIQTVFAQTGRKIEVDDPLVAAALVNSQTILRAGEIAVGVIEAAARGMTEDLADATRSEREAAKVASEGVAEAIRLVGDAARVSAESEAVRLKGVLSEAVERALRDVRREALTDAPAAWKLKIAIAGSSIGVICALAGGIIGYGIAAKQATPSLEESRELAAGRDFLAVLPKLDADTKKKIVDLIKERP